MSTQSAIAAYLSLCKIKVVLLMVFSAIVGMLLCYHPNFPWMQGLAGITGIALVASAGGTLNQIIDQDLDTKMTRTKKRPLATGSITPQKALLWALFLLTSGSTVLWCFTNPLTTYLTVCAMCGYAFIYTKILKPNTPQNIVIGGISGAIPPLLGWTSITGSIDTMPILLVTIIYLWTPPHFWALAIAKKQDYAQAKVPMLPITHGVTFTKLQIVLYTFLMVLSTLLPISLGLTGIIYLAGICLLNVYFIILALQLYYDPHHKRAMQLFHYSITYLMILFALILLDHVVSV